jgi:hypothetical protein
MSPKASPKVLWLPCLILLACVNHARPVVHAPMDEAARFVFPSESEISWTVTLPGNMAAATQLAMDDFLPWDIAPPAGTPPANACLYQRESYDVAAVPLPGEIILVRFDLNEDICQDTASSIDATTGAPPVAVTTYAIDVRTLHILSTARHWRPGRSP